MYEHFIMQKRRVQKLLRTNDLSATNEAKKLTEEYPNESDSWRTLAHAYEVEENYPAVFQAYAQAIQCEPGRVIFFVELAQNHLLLANYEQAITDCSHGLGLPEEERSESFRWELYLLRAEALFQLGRKAEALADLTHVPDKFSYWTIEKRSREALLALCADAVTPENDGRYIEAPGDPEIADEKWQLPEEPSEEETALAAKLGPEGLAKADASLLNWIPKGSRKVARVLMDAIEADDLHPNDAAVEVYLRRLIGLADKGLIEVFGNIRRPRYSEVQLPEKD